MSEPEHLIDFRGFATTAAAAAKPDFADVLARSARRRRRRNWFGAGFAALAVALGSGTAVISFSGDHPSPNPAPTPTVRPWHTTIPKAGGEPQPQPTYTEADGAWDVTVPDEPLTGMYPELMAGDVDHLYLNYQNCAVKPCRTMLATTADRGRTWRKLPMPVPPAGWEGPGLTMASGPVLLAGAGPHLPGGQIIDPGKIPDPIFWASTDAGATWQRAKVRTVNALPSGWPVFQSRKGLFAVDPADGDIAALPSSGGIPTRALLNTPPAAGIWTQTSKGIEVSQDGGRTWNKRSLPPGGAGRSPELATTDGRTVYVARELKGGGLVLNVSTDGGNTWAARGTIDLGGPLLTVLAIDDRTVLVEGVHGTYRSTDQGHTFALVGPSLGYRAHAVPGGFTIPTNNNEYSAWVSPDGAEWTYVKRPPIP
ncbi:WD40/YVTN/BNR-like repeat-containing protein [Actinoplanes sp. HUAS TT8]|uniref:WD40/YVTN/BNR-like repeat-containing protein n=1 Tax=Actinoplanes sp. HUAS TT8 TaxID=3447453 RepID=UPI003F5232C7